MLPFPTRIISENIKIYPHNLPKKGILWSYYVSVFFKTNHLSADFVHCLPKDGSFLKAKNLDFCNFSPHFSPHALPHESPAFPFQRGSLRSQHSRSSSLAFSPSTPLSGGWLWGDFGAKPWEYFRNIADFSINLYCSGGAPGGGLRGLKGSR